MQKLEKYFLRSIKNRFIQSVQGQSTIRSLGRIDFILKTFEEKVHLFAQAFTLRVDLDIKIRSLIAVTSNSFAFILLAIFFVYPNVFHKIQAVFVVFMVFIF